MWLQLVHTWGRWFNGQISSRVYVESELDGLLFSAEAGTCWGCQYGQRAMKPDSSVARAIDESRKVLFCLDQMMQGSGQLGGIGDSIRGSSDGRLLSGKDPGEMYKAEISIRAWIEAGL